MAGPQPLVMAPAPRGHIFIISVSGDKALEGRKFNCVPGMDSRLGISGRCLFFFGLGYLEANANFFNVQNIDTILKGGVAPGDSVCSVGGGGGCVCVAGGGCQCACLRSGPRAAPASSGPTGRLALSFCLTPACFSRAREHGSQLLSFSINMFILVLTIRRLSELLWKASDDTGEFVH